VKRKEGRDEEGAGGTQSEAEGQCIPYPTEEKGRIEMNAEKGKVEVMRMTGVRNVKRRCCDVYSDAFFRNANIAFLLMAGVSPVSSGPALRKCITSLLSFPLQLC
jgi:hypothetical protein